MRAFDPASPTDARRPCTSGRTGVGGLRAQRALAENLTAPLSGASGWTWTAHWTRAGSPMTSGGSWRMIVAASELPASALRAVMATRMGLVGSPLWLSQVATSVSVGDGMDG